MKTRSVGILVMLSVLAFTERSEAETIWVGFADSTNGFLIDLDTRVTTMTGSCLRPVQPVQLVNGKLQSANSTLEDLGRVQVRLDQTFTFDLRDDGSAVVTVENPERGGIQSFPSVLINCAVDPFCQDLLSAPSC